MNATPTSTDKARHILMQFEAIRTQRGHAAIDFRNGELVLMCTKPTDNPKTWGRGAVPMTMTGDWVRLVEC